MKGQHRVIVYTKRLHYDFTLKRNITVIRGDSATGKTTLVDMIQEYTNNPSGSPVELVCDKKCFVLSGALWKEQLSGIRDSIVFIDEGNEFVKTVEFAGEIQKTDNYYVIVTRESLPALPYSVEEIYGIRVSGKYGTLKQCFQEFYRIYGADVLQKEVRPQTVITEDSNSGYQFFESVCKDYNLECISAEGKSNIFHFLNGCKEKNILIIADGAAFGSEIDRVMRLMETNENASLYLPESFEWLLLSSDLFQKKRITQILEKPSEYIESENYFSWERFFTAFLVEETKNTYLEYTKKNINKAYLGETVKKTVLSRMEKIVWE